MSVASEAEKFVKDWYKSLGHPLVPKGKGETGFDYRTLDGSTYVEVKGTGAERLSGVLFRYLTNLEYERLKWCLRNGKEY